LAQPVVNPRPLALCCSSYQANLKERILVPLTLNVLIAHEDQVICRQIIGLLKPLPFSIELCRKSAEAIRRLAGRRSCLLLLDVAFAGGFPFELIAQAKQQRDGCDHKVVLLSSVYNKTAYKKRPTALYGADRHLELHHIGDSLLPLIAELFPHWNGSVAGGEKINGVVGERHLAQLALPARALAFCRLLVADIALYHQDRLLPGMDQNQARLAFADCLAEGRALLLTRLPEAAALPEDCLLLAFDEFYASYSWHKPGS
jgi:hypothetical protein